MKPMRELIGRELKWRQPRAMDRFYELKDDDTLVATLRFRSAFGSFATVEAAEGQWTFKRVGFWQTRVTVCVAGVEGEIAAFRNNTWSAGGTLELPGGRAHRANSNFWATSYEFKNANDEPLVRFRRFEGLIHPSAIVVATPAAAELAELPWLVGLGWYLVIKMRDDVGGAAAAAAAAG